jgi:type II secretory pathway component PulF
MSDEPIQLEYAFAPSKRRPLMRRYRHPMYELVELVGSTVLYSFAALFLIGLLFGWWASLLGIPGSFAALLAGLLFIPTLTSAVSSARRRRSAAVVGYLQQAVRLNLPLNRVLIAAIRSEKGRTARRLAALLEDIEAGFSLGDAVAQAVPEMSLRTLGLIDYATKVGSLPETLNRLAGEDLQSSRRQRNDQAFAAWYPALLLAVAAVCVSGLGIFVMPKFIQIFHDFHVTLPAMSLWILWVGDWSWILGPVILLMLILCMGFQLRQTVRINPPILLLSSWRDRIAWHLPLFHRLILDRNMSDICVALADSTKLGYPLNLSLERLGQLELNAVLQRRILTWADALRAGMNPTDAARHARMPALLVGMMAGARDTAALAEVFAFVGRFHTDRFLLRREAIRAAVIPVFTLIMGIMVALVALAIFVPMQQLIVMNSW